MTLKNAAWMSMLKTKTIREEVTGKSSATTSSIMLKKFKALKYRGNATSALTTSDSKNDITKPPTLDCIKYKSDLKGKSISTEKGEI